MAAASHPSAGGGSSTPVAALTLVELHRGKLSDAELEAHIKSCGLLLLKAYREEDEVLACQWLAMLTEAVNARSAHQISRMEGAYFAQRVDAKVDIKTRPTLVSPGISNG